MYDIVILTHGPLAEAYRTTLRMFTSRMEGIYALGLGEAGPEEFERELSKLLRGIPADHEVLALCDLFGGSPFNIAARVLQDRTAAVVAGMNLPLLIEASIQRDNTLAAVKDSLQAAAKEALTEFRNVTISEEDE